MERAGVSMVNGLDSVHGTVWVNYGPSRFVFGMFQMLRGMASQARCMVGCGPVRPGVRVLEVLRC